MKYRDPITGEIKTIHAKASDTLPVGTVVEFDGDEIPAGWEPAEEFASVHVGPNEPTDGQELWIKRSINLWDYRQVVDTDNFIFANGSGIKLVKTADKRVSSTYNINLKANKTYCISCKFKDYTTSQKILYCIWYDKSGNNIWVPNIDKEEVIFTPTVDIVGVQFYNQPSESDGAYIEIEELQIEEGTKASKYQKFVDKDIYAKNENGIYELFSSWRSSQIKHKEKELSNFLIGETIYIEKKIKIPAADTWYDTGITKDDIPTGLFAFVAYIEDTTNTGMYWERIGGMMTWYQLPTNSNVASEIPTHQSGHANNSREIKFRTKRNGGNAYMTLQISSTKEWPGEGTVRFYFRKIL